jgi:hypothetical protein
VKITGPESEISGGALIGCEVQKTNNLPVFVYGYVFQGQAYPVTGTPAAGWSVTIGGKSYLFAAADEGKTWTAETMTVAVLGIAINGSKCDESPGYLVYWPLEPDPNDPEYVSPPTSGSNGAYFDADNDPHTVEFHTTWSVPDFQTTFTWNSTDPYAGPYTCKPHGKWGDDDTWVSGDPVPGTH